MWVWSTAWAGATWPSLSDPPNVGGGEHDAALVVGIGDYWAVPDVPGAADNARDWYTWLTHGRGVPAGRVRLLVDAEATREAILEAAAALRPDDGGAVWIVFVGHGAPARDGRDGLLLGADTQASATSIEGRSVSRTALLASASASGAPVVAVLDACFSGRDGRGEALVPGLQPLVPTWAAAQGAETVLSAGGPDQFAGPLPGLDRPAFSYLALGALHGWGDADEDGSVRASEAVAWADEVIRATVTDRTQEPRRSGEDRVLSTAGKLRPLDLAALRLAAPTARTVLRAPGAPTPAATTGLGVNVAAEAAWANAVAVSSQALATPDDVQTAWCDLARIESADNTYAEPARAACDEWTAYEQDVNELVSSYQEDYGELRKLLKLPTPEVSRKAAAADAVAERYGAFEPARYATRDVERARDRLSRGRQARLGAWSGPYAHELLGERHGVFFAGWDPRLLKYPITGFNLGAGVEGGAVAAVVSLASIHYGPVELALYEGSSFGDNLAWRFKAGFVPFSVRTSRRHPGELRGSVLNPAVGVGIQSGKRALGEPDEYGFQDEASATFLDAYVADTMFATNALGLRGEVRFPVVPLSEKTRRFDLAPQFTASLVLNLSGMN